MATQRYVRDIPRGDDEALDAERAHVVAYLSALVADDDDPETNADDARVEVVDHPDHADMLRIVGEIDGEPDAPYLRSGYDPFDGVNEQLRQEVFGDGA